MHILVTGATGLVGNLVARRLLGEGHTIRVLVRRADAALKLQQVFRQTAIGDITKPKTLPGALKNIDTVIHCAALVGSGRGSEDEYMHINAFGTQALVEAAKNAGAQRFVIISTVGVYGPNTMKSYIDETTPYAGANGFTNSKIAAEKAAIASGVPTPSCGPIGSPAGATAFSSRRWRGCSRTARSPSSATASRNGR